MNLAPDLRSRAEALGQTLPPLLAEAEMLASTVMMGEHGRRRAGLGDEFWQYRPAHMGDSARMIDWRRSARSDAHFVREREWQAAQSVTIWVDPAKSMGFTGDKSRAPKADRAKLLALALAVLLLRGGERVGLAGLAAPRSGRAQLLRLAARLAGEDGHEDFGAPETSFTICTFWYIDALAAIGRIDEARALFERVLQRRNPLGLLSEDQSFEDGEAWGNFPQTYSHVGLIIAAMRLSKPWREMV